MAEVVEGAMNSIPAQGVMVYDPSLDHGHTNMIQ